MITITETLYKKMPEDIKACFNQLPNPSSEEVRECFPESTSGARKAGFTNKETGYEASSYEMRVKWDKDVPAEKGNASRFFKSIVYTAKASKRDRDEGLEGFEVKQATGGGGGIGDYLDDVNSASGKFGSEKAPQKNHHPTVKPTELMRYLCRMVTPKGGTVLDPFMGSGSTGKGAKLEHFSFIGIELDPEYYEIAQSRIKAVHPTLL